MANESDRLLMKAQEMMSTLLEQRLLLQTGWVKTPRKKWMRTLQQGRPLLLWMFQLPHLRCQLMSRWNQQHPSLNSSRQNQKQQNRSNSQWQRPLRMNPWAYT